MKPVHVLQRKIDVVWKDLKEAIDADSSTGKILAAAKKYASARCEKASEIQRLEDHFTLTPSMSEVSMLRKRVAELAEEIAWLKGTRSKEHWVSTRDDECALYSVMPHTFETAKFLRLAGERIFHVITTVREVDLQQENVNE
jgi:hypothetical protein